MSKLRYLIGKGADRKLKRNVPVELRALANKWAWVQRLPGKSADEIRRQQQIFALWTGNGYLLLGGTFEPFSKEELLARYPSNEVYVKAVSAAANDLVERRHILQTDAEPTSRQQRLQASANSLHGTR